MALDFPRRVLTSLTLLLLLLLVPSVVGAPRVQDAAPEKRNPDLPDDFKQLLERGRIAAVDDPQFVPAAEADLAADAWVLGVVIEGEARAYSLNLLNHHEVVNDQVGDQTFAAVW